MEYYPATNENEMQFGCKWMELEITTLSKATQIRKTNTTCFLPYVDASFESLDMCVSLWEKAAYLVVGGGVGQREARALLSKGVALLSSTKPYFLKIPSCQNNTTGLPPSLLDMELGG